MQGENEIVNTARKCEGRDCNNCIRLRNNFPQEDDCRRDLLKDAANLIESLQIDAASYQQVKKRLSDEGFSDLPTMIKRYKQVMFDANEVDMTKDAEIAELTGLYNSALQTATANAQLLDEAQRRERAAVEIVTLVGRTHRLCGFCEGEGDRCKRDDFGGCSFDWRGPEAGKGEAE